MRVAIVTESFLPSTNGVTNSVLRVLEGLSESGDQGLVIAPAQNGTPASYAGHLIKTTGAIPTQNFLPIDIPMAIPQKRIRYLFEGFNPDLVHLASPFVLGSYAIKVAKQLQIPTLSVYQTDLGGFAKQNGFAVAQNTLQKILYRIHAQSDRTLAPSNSTCLELQLAGVPNVFLWQRGVDTVLFNPKKRSTQLQMSWRGSNSSKTIVGYVGRLAKEKRVSDLIPLNNDPNIQLVIVGDGAHRAKLEQQLPNAIFLGFQSGQALAQIFASLDLFIHPGPNETFCQTIQEALASGVPVIAANSGGPVDLVANNRTGYLVDTSDATALMKCISNHRARSDRKQMRIAARDSVSMRTWQMINAQLKVHYQAVISQAMLNKRERVGVA